MMVASLAISGCSEEKPKNPTLPTQKMILTNGTEFVTITVEMAISDKEREYGLMYRNSLGANKGMFFDFPTRDIHKFWMKNTTIPLDIIFLKDREVIAIVEDAKPHDLTPLGPDKVSDDAIEMPAGFVRKHNIREGWKLRDHY
jgi:uncharacterized membrane protein (UPF0127 family)